MTDDTKASRAMRRYRIVYTRLDRSIEVYEHLSDAQVATQGVKTDWPQIAKVTIEVEE